MKIHLFFSRKWWLKKTNHHYCPAGITDFQPARNDVNWFWRRRYTCFSLKINVMQTFSTATFIFIPRQLRLWSRRKLASNFFRTSTIAVKGVLHRRCAKQVSRFDWNSFSHARDIYFCDQIRTISQYPLACLHVLTWLVEVFDESLSALSSRL